MTSTKTDVLRRRISRLVRGTQSAPSANGTSAPKPIGAEGIPGRLVRPVAAHPVADQPHETEGTDPAETAAVRSGWLLLDAYERLSRRGADRIFGHEMSAWYEYAEDTLGHLVYTLSDGKELVPENRKNRLRFRRTLDFARPGETVFDVGFGRGLLAAQLIKDRGVERYHGIDIVDRYVPTATDLFHVNGLAPDTLQLAVGDLYNLTRADIEATGATFVICCEVLEHVPDAELALKTLADALPEGADLLFSVPMFGRIEGAWGHVSVFDVARLKAMLDGAGLIAHHVEPLANAWSLIVASRDPAGSKRVRESAGRPTKRVAVPLSQQHDFVYVKHDQVNPLGDTSVLPQAKGSSKFTVSSGDGVSFDVKGLQSLRLMFKIDDIAPVSRVVVKAYAGDRVASTWTWKVKPGTPSTDAWITTSMRPGEVGLLFIGGRHEGVDEADRVEITFTVETGKSVETRVRAAYLP